MCKGFFIGAFASTYYSMLGLEDVINNVVKKLSTSVSSENSSGIILLEDKFFDELGTCLLTNIYYF